MKLYATLKNERGGKKSTGDNTRIQVELSYGNKILGIVGLYSILDDKKEGYRVVWQEEGKAFDPNQKPILEVCTDKKLYLTSDEFEAKYENKSAKVTGENQCPRCKNATEKIGHWCNECKKLL